MVRQNSPTDAEKPPTGNQTWIRRFSLLSALSATGLAGLGCLGCVPFLGAAIASTGISELLDGRLVFLQVSLLMLSAIGSGYYFRQQKLGKTKAVLGAIFYAVLIVNAFFLQNRILALGALSALIITHRRKLVERSALPKLRLLFFPGCPTYPVLKKILRDEGFLSYEEIDLEKLPENDPLRSYSSPSLLFGGEVLVGTLTSHLTMSCSMFSQDEMTQAVKQAARRIQHATGMLG